MDVELRRGETRAVLSPDGSIRVHMRTQPHQKQQQGGTPGNLALEQELRLIEEELERRRPFVEPSSSSDSVFSTRSDAPSPVHRQHIDTAWSESPRDSTSSAKTSLAYDLALHASHAVPAFSSEAILSPRPRTSNARMNGSEYHSRSFFPDGDELVSSDYYQQQHQLQQRPSSVPRMSSSRENIGDDLSQRIQQFKFRVQGNRRKVAGLSEGKEQHEHSPLQHQQQRQSSALFVSADGHIGRFETPVMPQTLAPQSDVCRPVLISPPHHTVGIARLSPSRHSSISGEMVQSPLAHLRNESNRMNGWDASRQKIVPSPPIAPPPVEIVGGNDVKVIYKNDGQKGHQLSQAREEEERYRAELKQLERKLLGLETEQARSQRQRRDSDSKLKQADSVVGRLNSEIQKLQKQLKIRDTKIQKLAKEKAIAEAKAAADAAHAAKAAVAAIASTTPPSSSPPSNAATPVAVTRMPPKAPSTPAPTVPEPVDTSAVPPSPTSMPARAASSPAPEATARRSANLSRTMSSTVDVANLSRTKLKEGMVFMKHGKHGKPHLRFVCLSEDSENILYGPAENVDESKTNKIPVSSITGVKKGHVTEVFKRSKRGRAHACFSIITSDRTLDLEIVPFGPMTTTRKHLESDARDFWVTAMKLLAL